MYISPGLDKNLNSSLPFWRVTLAVFFVELISHLARLKEKSIKQRTKEVACTVMCFKMNSAGV